MGGFTWTLKNVSSNTKHDSCVVDTGNPNSKGSRKRYRDPPPEIAGFDSQGHDCNHKATRPKKGRKLARNFGGSGSGD